LLHGFGDSSFCWIANGDKSGAVILAKNGFDVWMPNSRGNKFSKMHKYLDPDSHPDYWDFSFEEMAQYDTKATLEHIEKSTGEKKIACVGISQGGAQMLYGLARYHEWYKDHVSIYIALCPVINPGPNSSILTQYLSKRADKIERFFDYFHIHEAPKQANWLSEFS